MNLYWAFSAYYIMYIITEYIQYSNYPKLGQVMKVNPEKSHICAVVISYILLGLQVTGCCI